MPPTLIKLLRFLAVGIPAFIIAIPLNYFLVEQLFWSKSAAYALVLVVQVTINFFACIFFVFKRDVTKSIGSQFAIFMTGILAARMLDWALYSFLVTVVPIHYLAIQFFNVILFSLAKFTFARRTIEGKQRTLKTSITERETKDSIGATCQPSPMPSAPSTMPPYRNVFNLWLSYVTGMVCFGWLLSALDAYRWMGAAALLLVCALGYRFHRSWRLMPPVEKNRLKDDLRFRPVLLLLILIALAGSLYTTAVLDSLSYRIPRMLMWLQEGGIHFMDNPDDRLNFMTPIWEFASTPFYQLTGLRMLWLGSGISWVLLYLAFVFLAGKLGADPRHARWLAIIPSASVGFVLQAASTMNDGWAAAFLAVSLAFILMFEEKREFRDLVSSGLALALAAGAKPHFTVLALPWLVWFFLSKSNPLAAIRWRWVLPLAVVTLTCSPLPTFLSNHIHYGSFKGPAGDGGFALGAWWLNILLGSLMMGWSVFQLPVNPWAGSLDKLTKSWIDYSGLQTTAPRFGLGARELSIVDSASLGLIAAVILSFGALIAIRKRQCCPAWASYAAIAAVLGFIAAVSQVVPGTLGRSFLGFIVIAMPLCMAGLLRMNPKALIFGATLCFLVSMAAIVVSPSHPLLPLKSATAKNVALSTYLKPYFAFQERTVAGASLVRKIPDGPHEIGILANSDQNLVHLWGDRATRNTVKFHPKSATPDTLHSSTSDYLILAGSVEGVYLELREKLIADGRFEVLAEETYQTKNERGPETWTLIRPVR